MLDDQEVDTIYSIADEWLRSINLHDGHARRRAATRREAREAFRAEWDAKAARLGVGHVARALVARGKP